MRKTAAWLGLAVLLLGLAAGCAAGTREEDPGLELWFPIDPELGIASAALDACPYQGEDPSIPGLLSALLAGPPPEEVEFTSLVPEGTRVLSWSMEEGVANVELSAAYAELAGVELTVTDYCITLTLSQLPGVDGVRITVNGGGQSYRDRRVLHRSDVLFSGAEETPVDVSAALYFRRDGGDALGFELRRFRVTEGRVPAKEVLSGLAAGPEDKGLLPLLPEELAVRSAWADKGLCTADLSAHLLEIPEEDRALAAASIVETLCSLDGVEQVLILIEGEPVEEFGGLDLTQPLRPSTGPQDGQTRRADREFEPEP